MLCPVEQWPRNLVWTSRNNALSALLPNGYSIRKRTFAKEENETNEAASNPHQSTAAVSAR